MDDATRGRSTTMKELMVVVIVLTAAVVWVYVSFSVS
jgi:hypothetical protein